MNSSLWLKERKHHLHELWHNNPISSIIRLAGNIWIWSVAILYPLRFELSGICVAGILHFEIFIPFAICQRIWHRLWSFFHGIFLTLVLFKCAPVWKPILGKDMHVTFGVIELTLRGDVMCTSHTRLLWNQMETGFFTKEHADSVLLWRSLC